MGLALMSSTIPVQYLPTELSKLVRWERANCEFKYTVKSVDVMTMNRRMYSK